MEGIYSHLEHDFHDPHDYQGLFILEKTRVVRVQKTDMDITTKTAQQFDYHFLYLLRDMGYLLLCL